MMNTEPQTWRELLADLIKDSQERQRVATELKVHPVTLSHWVNGTSSPRPHIIRHLLRILPEEFREPFAPLVAEEFPNALTLKAIASTAQEEEVPSVPEDFYERVLHIYQSTPTTSPFWLRCEQILHQGLAQLDPQLQGINIVVAKCIPEHE
jgi:transcriptional regulator with XRE-family HTH domain